ncbi:hypothetical protein GCM10027299_09140 [Larkinella ripae]
MDNNKVNPIAPVHNSVGRITPLDVRAFTEVLYVTKQTREAFIRMGRIAVEDTFSVPLVDDIIYTDKHLVFDSVDASMAPTLMVNGQVLAEEWDVDAIVPGVYVIVYNGEMIIRRLKENAFNNSQTLTLHSDNEAFGSITIDKADIERVWKGIMKFGRL